MICAAPVIRCQHALSPVVKEAIAALYWVMNGPISHIEENSLPGLHFLHCKGSLQQGEVEVRNKDMHILFRIRGMITG